MTNNKNNKSNILMFGSYPQTIKEENVIIDKSENYKINFWDCFKGSDDNYYVEEIVSDPNNLNCNNITLSNGRKITSGEKLFFKIEPIKWNIITYDNNRKFLLSDKVLDCYPFDTHYDGEVVKERKINNNKIFPSNYEYSTVRAFLNSLNGESYDVDNFSNQGFIHKAFSKTELEQLKNTTVDNSISSICECAQDILDSDLENPNNTYDKVFLLSLREIEKLDESYLTKYATDYALIKGVPTVFGKNNSCCWWLRSPDWTEMYGIAKVEAACVDAQGCYDIGIHVDLFNGIVPAIYIV